MKERGAGEWRHTNRESGKGGGGERGGWGWGGQRDRERDREREGETILSSGTVTTARRNSSRVTQLSLLRSNFCTICLSFDALPAATQRVSLGEERETGRETGRQTEKRQRDRQRDMETGRARALPATTRPGALSGSSSSASTCGPQPSSASSTEEPSSAVHEVSVMTPEVTPMRCWFVCSITKAQPAAFRHRETLVLRLPPA